MRGSRLIQLGQTFNSSPRWRSMLAGPTSESGQIRRRTVSLSTDMLPPLGAQPRHVPPSPRVDTASALIVEPIGALAPPGEVLTTSPAVVARAPFVASSHVDLILSLIHISEPTRLLSIS